MLWCFALAEEDAMPRNRRSAKKAGTDFENLVVNGLREALGDNNIQRAPRWGSKDKGDVVNLRVHGKDLVIEAKDVARLELPAWTNEAKLESANANAVAGIVIHKRRGTRNPLEQWVTMTLAELVALLTNCATSDKEVATKGSTNGGHNH
jgi:hypothetical protein